MKIKVLFIIGMMISSVVQAETKLDENCIINVLNRTIQVSKNGGWALPNVPSNMGRVRARATCTLPDGKTVSGQSDYFTLTNNAVTNVGKINFDGLDAIPTEINFSSSQSILLSNVGEAYQAKVFAKYRNQETKDVTAAVNGINYSSTNSNVATVNGDGVITATGNGNVLINARKDGVLASLRVSVTTSGDLDGDGLPDDWEIANGLNPADAIDAQEDKDGDKLSALDEYNQGSDPSKADTDSDGLDDFEEVNQYNTSPVLSDSDGDGLNDRVEILTSTDPRSSLSANYSSAIQSISVDSTLIKLTFNGVDREVSRQLVVTATLIDGSVTDITSKQRGTVYSSSDLSVASFGLEDGRVFGGQSGNALVRIQNGSKTVSVAVVVDSFTPKVLSSLSIPGYANNVDVKGDVAFIAAGAAGLVIVDTSNKRDPKVVSALDTDGVAIDVRVKGNYVYLADGQAGLKIIDVSIPTAPILVSSLDMPGVTQDLQIRGNIVYLANGDAGISVVDVSQPATPIVLGSLSGMGVVKGIDVENDLLGVVAGSAFYLIDARDKLTLVKLNQINIGEVKDIAIVNGFAHVAAYSNGYRVVNMRDLANVQVVAGEANFVPRDVEISSRGLAFYAEQLFPNVVAFVNIDDPVKSVFQGVIDLSSQGDYAGTGIALDASYVYITEENYVVSEDYKSSGNTKLFIAQYAPEEDNRGIPPIVNLNTPVQGDSFIENSNINIQASAADDIVVREVEFYVDGKSIGIDGGAPYEVSYTIPFEKRFVNLTAVARDLGNNAGESQIIRINILPDKDKDGLDNDSEAAIYLTDPNNADSDSDGLSDGFEVRISTNPLIADSDGDGLSDADEVSDQTDPLNPDRNKLEVESILPSDKAVGLPINVFVSVKLKESVLPKSVLNSSILVTNSVGEVVTGTVKQANERQVVFTPTKYLKPNSNYIVQIKDLKDIAGNGLMQNYQYSFSTGSASSTTFSVIGSSPKSNRDVPVNSVIGFEFNSPLDTASLNDVSVSLLDQTSQEKVPSEIQVGENGSSLSIVPVRPLAVGRYYTASIKQIKDLFGNSLYSASNQFKTSLISDAQSPKLVATSFDSGALNIPLNTKLKARFNEPMGAKSLNFVRLYEGGSEVSGTKSLEENNLIVFKPTVQLKPNTRYEWIVGEVQDLSGNLLPQEIKVTFQTGSVSDTTADRASHPGVVYDADTNSKISILFQSAIDKTSALQSMVYSEAGNFYDADGGDSVKVKVEFSSDQRTIIISPIAALQPDRKYQYNLNTLLDLGGNSTGYVSGYIETTKLVDATKPVLLRSNITNTQNNVPVNAGLAFQFDEPVSCVDSKTVKLVDTSSDREVEIDFNFYDGKLFIYPEEALSISTNYKILLNGICDLNGNLFSSTEYQFRSNSDSQPDEDSPVLVNSIPAESESLGAVQPIKLMFDEIIDSVKSEIKVVKIENDIEAQIHGDLEFSGSEVVFTPLSNYPSNKRITVKLNNISDISGNISSGSIEFQSENSQDVTAPRVVKVTPENGTMNVGALTPISVIFSESLNPNSINSQNFLLYSEGQFIPASVYHSEDNRTVLLRGNLPYSKTITLVVTSNVMDLSGNRLTEFASSLSTAIRKGGTAYSEVVRQTPISGSIGILGVDSISFFVNKSVEINSLRDGVKLAVNGALVPIDSRSDESGYKVTVTPRNPLPENATIDLFITDDLRDAANNRFSNYQGTFRTGSIEGREIGRGPSLISVSPIENHTNFTPIGSLNPVFEFAFDQKIDVNSLTLDSVYFEKKESNVWIKVPTTSSLIDDGRVLKVQPENPLEKESSYAVRITGIKDIDGESFEDGFGATYSTNSDTEIDTVAPEILEISPSDGSQNIPRNPVFHILFNEPMHARGFKKTVNDQLLFSWDMKEVLFAKYDLYQENSLVHETIKDVTDLSGNLLQERSFQFKTGTGIDFDFPKLLSVSPSKGLTDVPTGANIRLDYDEPIDPISFIGGSERYFNPKLSSPAYNYSVAFIRDEFSSQKISVKIDISSDQKSITLTPSEHLAVNREYSVWVRPVMDLAGNKNYGSSDVEVTKFKTGWAKDVTPPSISATSVIDEQNNVPTNAQLSIRFNEAINLNSFNQLSIYLNGLPVRANKIVSFDARVLTIIPERLLLPLTSYEMRIGIVEDLSGNKSAEERSITFETSANVDVLENKILSYSPQKYQKSVPLNAVVEIRFKKSLNLTTLTAENFSVLDSNGIEVKGNIELLDSGKLLRFKFSEQLKPNSQYLVSLSYIKDQVGKTLVDGYAIQGSDRENIGWYFTTGFSEDKAAPEMILDHINTTSQDLPLNPKFLIKFNEKLNWNCFSPNSVRMIDASSSAEVPITIEKQENGFYVQVNPYLTTNMNYRLEIQGLCDLSNNIIKDETIAFTTSGVSVVDTSSPQLVTLLPEIDSVNIAPDTSVRLAFNEPIYFDQTTASVWDEIGDVKGRWITDGENLTFTPASSFKPNSIVSINVWGVSDFAGNQSDGISLQFSTGNSTDKTPPIVKSISHENGSMDMDPTKPIVVVFSEPVRLRQSFNFFSKGVLSAVDYSYYQSIDGMSFTIPYAHLRFDSQLISFIIDNVEDYSGNLMPEYITTYSVTPQPNVSDRPSVVRQYPMNGTSGADVQKFKLWLNKPLDMNSLGVGLHVVNEGALVSGSISLDASKMAFTFTPDVAFLKNSLVQIFMDENVTDLAGMRLMNYVGSFRTAPSLSESYLDIESKNPVFGSVVTTLNPSIELDFNKILDGSSVNPDNVQLRRTSLTGEIVPAVIQLSENKKTILIHPDQMLLANTRYYVDLSSSLKSQDDYSFEDDYASAMYFTVAANATEDKVGPRVNGTSPSNGAKNVPIDAQFQIQFDEPVTQSSLKNITNEPFSLSYDYKSIYFTRLTDLDFNQTYAETIQGAKDISGNIMTPYQYSFVTNDKFSGTERPTLKQSSPASGGSSVAVNTNIHLQMSEAINSFDLAACLRCVSVSNTTTNTFVDVMVTVDADGQNIYLTPKAPLSPNTQYKVSYSGVRNLSGVEAYHPYYTTSFNFMTGNLVDTIGPQVTKVNFASQQSSIPLNAKLKVEFNEPINSLNLGNLTLQSETGEIIPVLINVGYGQNNITIAPSQLLSPLTQYNLMISGFKDLSGNSSPAIFQRSFTTSNNTLTQYVSKVEIGLTSDTSPNILVKFETPVDPLSFSTNDLRFALGSIQDSSTGSYIQTSCTLESDYMNLICTPSEPLIKGHEYELGFRGYSLHDYVGNAFEQKYTSLTFN